MESANVKITFIPDGPAKVECDRAEIVKRDGTMIIKEHHFMLCRCGASKNKPFCDGSHKECGFKG